MRHRGPLIGSAINAFGLAILMPAAMVVTSTLVPVKEQARCYSVMALIC
eukprot:SAG11_NODE_22497_length_405_cov_0.673203_1_plen_48_part_10